MRNKITDDTRGSLWNKWDLHIHSVYSKEKQAKLQISDIFSKAVQQGISVIAITDHSNVDGLDETWKVWEENEVAINGKKIPLKEIIDFFPGVELKTSVGKRGVHTIALFPKYVDGKKVDKNFLSSELLTKINCSVQDIKKAGEGNYEKGLFEKAVDFRVLYNKVHDLGGLIVVHAGGKSSGFENEIAHAKDEDSISEIWNSLGAEKRELMSNYIDVCEIPNSSTEELEEADFYLKKFGKPTILSSDSHKDYEGKQFSWIKARPTFKGLLQVINEPKERVFIGKLPPKLIDQENYKSNYIDHVTISAIENKEEPHWFDNKIPLNGGLIAIIGKKGSGKSALSDSIALAGASHIKIEDYSFLRLDKFRKKGIAKDYQVKIDWLDAIPSTINLNGEVDIESQVEKIKYLPQKFVETICNDDGVNKLFQREIDKVIFSYIPEEEKIETTDLKELIKLKTGLIDEKIQVLRNQISNINIEICDFEKKSTKSYSELIKQKLSERKRELKNLKKPKKINKSKIKLSAPVKQKIDQLSTKLESVNQKITEKQEKIKDVNSKIVKCQLVTNRLDTLSDTLEINLQELESDFKVLGIKTDEVFSYKLNTKIVNEKFRSLKVSKKKITNLLSKDVKNTKSLFYKQKAIQEELDKVFEKVDEKTRAYEEYKKLVEEYKEKRKEIEGKADDGSLETINSLKSEITYLKEELHKNLNSKQKDRNKISSNIYGSLQNIITFFEEIYSPVVRFIGAEKNRQKKAGSVLGFSVGVVFDKTGFPDKFLGYIDQGRDGSYQTKPGGLAMIKSIIRNNNLKTKKGILTFINQIIESLDKDKTQKKNTPKKIEDQILRGSEGKPRFYDYIYQLNYLDVKYSISFNGKDLNENEFSPGEIGTLLLIFYLLIDKNKKPLIIDQPEENLDNESIFKLLVPYIKRAKKERQIILVTHNPNLAVVCDAEQIICSKMNKKTNEIRYSSGSIENPIMNKEIVDVLEGTLPAFQNRDRKYFKTTPSA